MLSYFCSRLNPRLLDLSSQTDAQVQYALPPPHPRQYVLHIPSCHCPQPNRLASTQSSLPSSLSPRPLSRTKSNSSSSITAPSPRMPAKLSPRSRIYVHGTSAPTTASPKKENYVLAACVLAYIPSTRIAMVIAVSFPSLTPQNPRIFKSLIQSTVKVARYPAAPSTSSNSHGPSRTTAYGTTSATKTVTPSRTLSASSRRIIGALRSSAMQEAMAVIVIMVSRWIAATREHCRGFCVGGSGRGKRAEKFQTR